MSGYKKGQLALFYILVGAIGIMMLLIVINVIHKSNALEIKKTLYVSVEMEDRGTELISLMNSDPSGMKYMETIGDFSADNHEEYIDEHKTAVKASLMKIRGGGYNFYVCWPGGKESLQEGDLDCSLVVDKNIVLMWPVPDSHRIVSPYGQERTTPTPHMHGGIDIPGNGLNVVAAANGRVHFADWEAENKPIGFGKFIVIEHTLPGEKKFYTIYGHLSEMLVKAGQTVTRGQPIGKTGNTGYSTAPHLHFELADGTAKGRNSINPCPYLKYSSGKEPAGCADPSAPGISIGIYGTQIPLPGAQDDMLKGEAEFLC